MVSGGLARLASEPPATPRGDPERGARRPDRRPQPEAHSLRWPGPGLLLASKGVTGTGRFTPFPSSALVLSGMNRCVGLGRDRAVAVAFGAPRHDGHRRPQPDVTDGRRTARPSLARAGRGRCLGAHGHSGPAALGALLDVALQLLVGSSTLQRALQKAVDKKSEAFALNVEMIYRLLASRMA